MRRTHEPIPKDFEVQPLRPGQKAEDPVTCGHCGLTWDDGIGTTWTPAPSGRCPFEYYHIHEEEGDGRNIYEGKIFVQIIARNSKEADDVLISLCDAIADQDENWDEHTIFSTQIPKEKPVFLEQYTDENEEEEEVA
jgi:hypothetical protein